MPSTPDAGTLRAHVTHPASAPFAPGIGPIAFTLEGALLTVRDQGLETFAIDAPRAGASLGRWVFTSTLPIRTGVDDLAVLPPSPLGASVAAVAWSRHAAVAAIDLSSGGGGFISGNLLPRPTFFPGEILAPASGPGQDALWMSRLVQGIGGSVRSYTYDSWTDGNLRADGSRQFTLLAADLDGDGGEEAIELRSASLSDDLELGLALFSTAEGLGGVQLFSLVDGAPLAMIVPEQDPSVPARRVPASAALSGQWLVIAADAWWPSVSEPPPAPAQLSIYRVSDRRALIARTGDPMAFRTPSARFTLSGQCPCPIRIIADRVFAMSRRHVLDSSASPPYRIQETTVLELVDLGTDPPRADSLLDLGPIDDGYSRPLRLDLAPDSSALFVGTSSGVLRVAIERE